ncbi:hypothetical protein D8B31_19810 [Verminephrobacter eiseniae]|nr:hypothetical protein [Verminephrobacter eiseniae]MCW8186794.1 hypothetical protein [Verminephrobacter eiseniae]MCW8225156.1 hypothetical protein [Verminephrobacter eiseniae]
MCHKAGLIVYRVTKAALRSPDWAQNLPHKALQLSREMLLMLATRPIGVAAYSGEPRFMRAM